MRVELWGITPEAERHIAKAARVSRRASPGRKSDGALIRELIKMGHESVLEFAHATFFVGGISRACANQLTRHRLASFVQESQRYVNMSASETVIPPSFEKIPELKNEALRVFYMARELYQKMVNAGIRKEDARYVLPIGTETSLCISANFREWRHIIQLRGARAAQWEIRWVMNEILARLNEHAPAVFSDLSVET